ncbi:MAG: hypothetical protein ACRCTP_02250 [Aeromonas popoffii]|uniref:hypothetical protein n=1 Tax=Aeromonas popoffii TaxID=70856 RepID=UPI003F34504A
MFDIIGYWGILTTTLMFPILVAVWLFGCFTNARVAELGGAPVGIFKRFDKSLENPILGVPVIIGCIVSALLSLVWAVGTMTGKLAFTFIGFHSAFSEMLSPVSGFFIAAIVFMVVYDMALKGYVKVTKLVDKLEEKV